MKLLIQIPCYNEEETLKMTLDDLPEKIPGVDEIEYLIIDDGSHDDTVKVARECGVQHVIGFSCNKGLAHAFMAGLDGCLKAGADIIVNTDADNQYCGEDIVKLIQPILEHKADIVIGERPIDETKDFSWVKKKLQHIGSWAVRRASNTDIPDAPSGFRAFSKEGAMRLNVVNDYTYTLETIVQAGREKIPMVSVPIRTNPALRESRLARSMLRYVRTSMLTILRAYLVYKPLKAFAFVGMFPMIAGIIIWIRFIYYLITAGGSGHIQSLILACTLLIIGFVTLMIGVLGDAVSANRKILQDVQYHLKRMEYDEKH